MHFLLFHYVWPHCFVFGARSFLKWPSMSVKGGIFPRNNVKTQNKSRIILLNHANKCVPAPASAKALPSTSIVLCIFSLFCGAQDVLPTQNFGIWHPGNETQKLTSFLWHDYKEQLPNPTFSTSNRRFKLPPVYNMCFRYVTFPLLSIKKSLNNHFLLLLWVSVHKLCQGYLWLHFSVGSGDF